MKLLRKLFSPLAAERPVVEARDPAACPVCGHRGVQQRAVLWPGLIQEWELSAEEAAYIERQQGEVCAKCKAQLRVRTLAEAIMRHYGWLGTFNALCRPGTPLWTARILEVNEAGRLSKSLAVLPHHRLAKYPEVDLQALPFPESNFDLVLHSDTLEHIPDPQQALRECHRVLAPGGLLAFTVPVIVGRLTRTRDASMPPSFHGAETDQAADYRVHTEYGADVWCHLMQVGFSDVALHTDDFPASLTISAQRSR